MQSDGTELAEPSMVRIKNMLDLIHEAIQNVRENLSLDGENIELDKAMEIEEYINNYRDELLEYHYSQLENKTYSNKVGFVFLDYLNRLEKIGDHLFNVNEAIAGVKVKAAYEKVTEERG